MSKLTAKEVATKAKDEPGKFADGNGLYFVVPKRGVPYWMLRYTFLGKRKELTLGKYADLTLAEARAEAAIRAKEIRSGQDPMIAKRRSHQADITTVADLFQDWHEDNVRRLKHPQVPARVYHKDIAPVIGEFPLAEVSPRDIRTILQNIRSSNRPTIANDALLYCKQLFNHGIKLDLVNFNPAAAFKVSDAGGIEESKKRYLTTEELSHALNVMRSPESSFGRENYLAVLILLTLGVRKSELVEAPWTEFDLEKQLWKLPKARSKSGVAITIPLPDLAMTWLEELKLRACGSAYVFPNRRSSNLQHMSPDTLNRAIDKLFGKDSSKTKQPQNLMGKMEHFTVHDLRRTCRSLLAEIGTPPHIAERCLNHKLKGVEGIYDRHDYLEERREALTKLTEWIRPYI
ncbi:MAG: tyrosine-type recombinase/integrase [Shewanella algae]